MFWTTSERAKARNMLESGMTIEQVADHFGQKPKQVKSAIAWNNLRKSRHARMAVEVDKQNTEHVLHQRTVRKNVSILARMDMKRGRLTMDQLTESSCRYPMAENTFCGCRRYKSRSYCRVHAKRCYETTGWLQRG